MIRRLLLRAFACGIASAAALPIRAEQQGKVARAVAHSLAAMTVAALMSPLAGHAADPAQKVVRVGFVDPQSPSTSPRGLSAFWERLRELGYVEGQNLIVEARSAEGRSERLPALMNEVIERNVDVLVTWSTSDAIAAKHATSTVPIVAAVMGDPVGMGLRPAWPGRAAT